MKHFIYTIIFITGLSFTNNVSSQSWTVPAADGKIEKAVSYTEDNADKGKEIYKVSCKSCHGDPGKANNLPLQPPPSDVASEVVQANSDGALYFKITQGKGGMPKYESILSDDDRWNLVNYIRSFNAEYVKNNAGSPTIKKDPEKDASKILGIPKIDCKLIGENTMRFLATSDNLGKKVVLKNIPIEIMVKRTFGNYKIGEVTTDGNGEAQFTFPENLKGDAEGAVDLVLSLGDDVEGGEILIEKTKVCKPSNEVNICETVALWAPNNRTPLWLILSYVLVVGGIWLGILYVVGQIFKIKRLSK